MRLSGEVTEYKLTKRGHRLVKDALSLTAKCTHQHKAGKFFEYRLAAKPRYRLLSYKQEWNRENLASGASASEADFLRRRSICSNSLKKI